MKNINYYFFFLSLFFLGACQNNQELMTDADLIFAIENATGKQVINPIELPSNTTSLLNEEYSESYPEKVQLAPELGYLVRMRRGMGSRMGEASDVYFNLRGRELRRERDTRETDGRDRRECYELVFPVTFLLPDGTEVSGTAQELRQAISRWYEANADTRARPTLQYPVDIELRDGTIVTINEEEQMRRVYQQCE